MDVQRGPGEGLRELALFSGAGGGILGGILAGWRTVCAVELDTYAADVLVARQNDGCLPPFPIWDDVRTFDGRAWRGAVDVVSGGFPCQDISCAGTGKGLDGSRSGLWFEFARIVREVRPRYVFVENVPALTRRGLDRVLGDLASMGFNAQWGVLGAVHAGAPHRRLRIWIAAYAGADCERREQRRDTDSDGWGREVVGVAEHPRFEGEYGGQPDRLRAERRREWKVGRWWKVEPGMGRVADGIPHRVDRLRCLGNGQVPIVAASAWSLLADRG